MDEEQPAGGLTEEQLKVLTEERITLDVLIAPDKRLRKVAKHVDEVTFVERAQVEDMFETMAKSGGMGLAGPQVGLDKRIVVMDVEQLSVDAAEFTGARTHGRLAIINPVIVEASGQAAWPESCLSVPGSQDVIMRPATVVVNGLDSDGNEITVRAAGLLAACIQHEIDHLDGKLFIDYLSRLKKDMVMRKLKKFRKRGKMVVRAHQAPLM